MERRINYKVPRNVNSLVGDISHKNNVELHNT